MTDHYTFRITWSPEDGEHLGLCAELPSLLGIRKLAGNVLAYMRASGKSPPKPLADRTYSGQNVVRVPPKTHRDLVIKVAEQGVRLNRLVSAQLAG